MSQDNMTNATTFILFNIFPFVGCMNGAFDLTKEKNLVKSIHSPFYSESKNLKKKNNVLRIVEYSLLLKQDNGYGFIEF